jgi:hypothetical protein
MDEVLIERIFSEIDTLAKSVTKLSEIVHKDNALLQIIHKIVFCIVLAMISGSITLGWYQFQKEPKSNTTITKYEEKDKRTPIAEIKQGTIVTKKITHGG